MKEENEHMAVKIGQHISANGAAANEDATILNICGKVGPLKASHGYHGGPDYKRPRHMLKGLVQHLGDACCGNCRRIIMK